MVIVNVENFIALRLTPNNYPLWHEQALALAESQELVEHIIIEDSTPTKYTTLDPNTNVENFIPTLTENFIAWHKFDHFLHGWIIGKLSEEGLGFVVGLDTSHSV
jgi:hypothetical protein